MNQLEFFVPGIPATAGSKNAFYNKKTGKVNVTAANKRQKSWMSDVKVFTHEAYEGRPPYPGPVQLDIRFYLPRPKGHFGTGKNADRLKDSSPFWHIKTPDLTKLLRAVEDAMKGVVWNDDNQVVCQRTWKFYGDKCGPGAHVVVRFL